jgi:hypothetical protein
MGMSCGGAVGVLHPFIGSGRQGGGRPGSDGGGGAFSSGGRLRRGGEEEAMPIEGVERRSTPRGIRSRAEEEAGGARRHVARPSERRR